MMKNDISLITKKLFEKLREIYDDREFIIGILALLKDDSNKELMLKYINDTKDITDEQISIYALELNQKKSK